ncbi:hypothetical protein H0H93_013684 [Arthromyces matolae]|nr:hypothetical protein H0H93_013684 [Arthromyces matolae]
MFARLHTLFFVFLFALCASASVLPRTGGTSCNADTGTQQCCNQALQASDPLVGLLEGLLGLVLGPIDALVGINCSPITVIGAGGTQCNSQAVCCSGNTFSGLITVGCSPININL